MRADLKEILAAVEAAMAVCNKPGETRADAVTREWVAALLAELEVKLAANELPADYLNDFPLGNIIVHRLSEADDPDLVAALRHVDDLMLRIAGGKEYRKFLDDFGGH